MPRRAAKGEVARTATLTLRLTPAERLAIEQRATAAGLTPSAYAARRLAGEPVVIEQRETMAPALFVELSRIGNNINQLAHAANAGAPPSHQSVLKAMQELFQTLMQDEVTRRRVAAFERDKAPSRIPANGSQAPRTRDEFQGRVGLSLPR